MNQPNNFYLRIVGKVNVPELIEIGHNYKILIDASVTQEQKIDNNDGTFDIVSKAEPITVQIQKDNGPIVKAKDPRRNSQKIRNLIYKYWECNHEVDFDQFYDKVCKQILLEMDEIISRI